VCAVLAAGRRDQPRFAALILFREFRADPAISRFAASGPSLLDWSRCAKPQLRALIRCSSLGRMTEPFHHAVFVPQSSFQNVTDDFYIL
jgi:hypothetical protein